MLIRQGDLVLQRVGEEPATPPKSVPADLVLAVGEESGHSHRLRAAQLQPDLIYLAEGANLRVEGMPWRHDEIGVEPGVYKCWVEREYTPEAIRDVRD